MKFSEEQIKIAQSCGSAQELVEKAAQSGVDLSSEQAAAILASSEFEELDQECLDAVSGGCGTTHDQTCHNCKTRFDYDLPLYEYGPEYCDGNVYHFCDSCAVQLGLK